MEELPLHRLEYERPTVRRRSGWADCAGIIVLHLRRRCEQCPVGGGGGVSGDCIVGGSAAR
jgi:hypothetical protein